MSICLIGTILLVQAFWWRGALQATPFAAHTSLILLVLSALIGRELVLLLLALGRRAFR